jgi:hypothetical protein
MNHKKLTVQLGLLEVESHLVVVNYLTVSTVWNEFLDVNSTLPNLRILKFRTRSGFPNPMRSHPVIQYRRYVGVTGRCQLRSHAAAATETAINPPTNAIKQQA